MRKSKETGNDKMEHVDVSHFFYNMEKNSTMNMAEIVRVFDLIKEKTHKLLESSEVDGELLYIAKPLKKKDTYEYTLSFSYTEVMLYYQNSQGKKQQMLLNLLKKEFLVNNHIASLQLLPEFKDKLKLIFEDLKHGRATLYKKKV